MPEHPVAIVTGSAAGIGKAVCLKLAENNFRVIGIDKSKGQWPDSVNVCEIIFDLEKIVDRESLKLTLAKQLDTALHDGKLVALVNNAAVQVIEKAQDLKLEDFLRSFSVNALAPFALSQICFSRLRAHSGCIVNVSSIHARQSKKGFSAYSTSKAALSALTRNLSIEWGGEVRVNGVEPAAVATEMLLEGFDGDKNVLERLKALHPSGRISTPNEVAQIIFDLINNNNMNFTGNLIKVDGGISSVLNDL